MNARIDLLLLPGLTNDARLWRPVVAGLADVANASVGDLTTQDTMSAVARDALAHAPARFALAGMSMGGYCALEIMRQAPERVVALALIDTSARPDTPEGSASRQRQIERSRSDYAGVIEELLPKWIHPSRLDDAEVAGTVRAMAMSAGADTFARQQRAIMSRADSRPLLASIRCPTLVLCGRDDAVIPLEVHEEIVQGVAAAKLAIVEACGHLAPLERPDAVSAAMRVWLATVADRAPP
jgi:pimeloyl-ACP methyl ester carboxylesterase